MNNKLIGGNNGQISILSFNGGNLFNMNKSDTLYDLLKKIILDKQSILFKLVLDTRIIDLTSNLDKSLGELCGNNNINLVLGQDIKSLENTDLYIYKLLFSDNINVFKLILDQYNIPPPRSIINNSRNTKL